MGVVKNLMVRIVTDAAGLVGGMKKARMATAQTTGSIKESVAGMKKSVKSSFGSAQMSVSEYAEHVARTKESHETAIQNTERLTDKLGQMKSIYNSVKTATAGLDLSKPLEKQISEAEKEIESIGQKIAETQEKINFWNEIEPPGMNYMGAELQKELKILISRSDEAVAHLSRLESVSGMLGDMKPGASITAGLEKMMADINLTENELKQAQAQADRTNQKLRAIGIGVTMGQLVKAEAVKVKEAAAGIKTAFRDAAVDAGAGLQRMALNIKSIPANLLHRVTVGLNGISGTIRSLPEIPGRLWSGLKRIGTAASAAAGAGLRELATRVKDIGVAGLKGITTLPARLLGIGRSAAAGTGGLSRMVRSIRNIGAVSLGLRVAQGMFGRLRSIISQYISQNEALNASVTSLKNQMGQALAPAINIVIAALQRLMPVVNAVANAINSVFSAIFGNVTSTVAAVTASAEAAGGAAESLELYGFDQITKVSDNSGGGGGSSASTTETQTQEQSALVQKLTGWIQQLKDAFTAGDWDGLGKIIGDGINRAVAAIDGVEVGTRAGRFANNLVTTLHSTLSTTNFSGIGAKVADMLNASMVQVDWKKTGDTIAKGITAIPSILVGMIQRTDWKVVGKSLSELLSGALHGVGEWISKVDWLDLGRCLRRFVSGIDYGSIAQGLFSAMGSALGATVSLLYGALEGAALSVRDYFAEKIEECGGNVVEGLLKGILDAIVGIGTWIYDNIFTPFIDGFKRVFGIHSPSTVMEEQGGFLIQGLLIGMTNAWKNVVSFVSEGLASIRSKFVGAWTKCKDETKKKWSEISSTVTTKLSDMKSKASERFKNIQKSASDAWNNCQNETKKKWSDMATTLTGKLNDMKSKASERLQNIRTATTDAWNSCKTETGQKWAEIASTFQGKLSDMKSQASEKLQSIRKTAADAWNNCRTDTAQKWSEISSTVSEKLVSMKTAASEKLQSIRTSAIDAWNGCKSDTNEKWGEISTTVSDKLMSMASTASDKFRDIRSTVSDTWATIQTNTSTAIGQMAKQATTGFGDIKQGIIDAFSGAWNGTRNWLNKLIGGVESMVNYVIRGINKMIDGLNKIASLGDAIGLDLEISKINSISLPRLATGGITQGATAAIIGEAGKEAVLPLEGSHSVGWMTQLANKIVELSRNGGGNPIQLTIPIYMGSRKVTEYVIKDINQITRTTGVCPVKV